MKTKNHQEGNQEEQEYNPIHQEFLAANREAIATEAEKQQIGTEAAAATRKYCEHPQPTSARGHPQLVDALELESDQYPSHAPQNQNRPKAGI